MREQKPYAQYYDQGHTDGLAGVPVDNCPYERRHACNASERLETMARRMAWLEGHADGTSKRLQIEAGGRLRNKRPRIPKAAAGRLVRSTIGRRYQRQKLLDAGGPERYVDRRLRQIAEDEQPVTTVLEAT